MTRIASPITCGLVLGLSLLSNLACKPKGTHDHGADAGHAHEAPERPGFSPTRVADGLELFVEYPVLVAGEDSAFGIHLTYLADHKAVSDGQVEVILTGAGGEQRFHGELSPTPGIFRVSPKPARSGVAKVQLRWKGIKGQATFDLGTHTVYPDLASAMKAEVPEPTPGIPFLKEQQWNVPFGTVPAQERSLAEGFEAFAAVQAVPGGEGRILAPVAGRLEGPGFPSIGQPVKQGQRLGGLVPKAGADLALGSTQLDFEKARLHLEQARANHTRLKGLLDQDAVPRRRVEEAAREEALAEAGFKVAQARREEVTTGRGGMALALSAPVSGTVSAVNGGPGMQVTEGQELIHIVDTRRLRLEVQVPEAQAARVAKIASVWFQTPGADPVVLAPGRSAQLLGVGGAIHPERRTLPLLLAFQNLTGALKVGATGKAFVRTGAGAPTLAVPATALQDEDGLAVVYVQTGGERFQRRIVRAGLRDGEWVQVLSGVQAGERVVTTGGHLVRLAASSGKAPEHGHAH